ncbi:MAG: uroporphyrinogen decarboxylase family protein [Nitrososphaeria archaeon]
MNPRERFIKALSREKPDRVPVFVFGINGSVLEKLLCRPVMQRNPKAYLEMCSKGEVEKANLLTVEDHIELVERFDLDAVREVNQVGGWLIDPRWEYFPKDCKVVKRGENLWEIDGVPVQYMPEVNSLYVLKPFLPTDPDKAKEFLKSIWNDVTVPDQETVVLEKIASRLKGKRFILSVIQGTFLPFFSPSTHMMVWLHRNPDILKMWLEYYLRVNIERAKAKIDAGAEGIIENDDYATTMGPMISPKYFRDLIIPNLKRLCDVVHKKGAFFIKHTDGNISLILEDIVNTGIDGIHPIEKKAGMDIGQVKKLYGKRVCVIGNIEGSLGGDRGREHIVNETLELLKNVAPGGGYIMTTSNVITSDAKVENFLAWIDTVKKFGRYGD